MKANKYSVRFLSLAEHDLQELTTYIAAENITAALALLETIHRECLKLGAHPYLGRIPNDQQLRQLGYRMLIVENYIIFHKIKKKIVPIYRIIHGARDFKILLQEHVEY